jgi:hypothetical protein
MLVNTPGQWQLLQDLPGHKAVALFIEKRLILFHCTGVILLKYVLLNNLIFGMSISGC